MSVLNFFPDYANPSKEILKKEKPRIAVAESGLVVPLFSFGALSFHRIDFANGPQWANAHQARDQCNGRDYIARNRKRAAQNTGDAKRNEHNGDDQANAAIYFANVNTHDANSF